MIPPELLPLLGATAVTALLHAIFPTHWLPFALVGRAQRWPAARLCGIAAVAATGHALVTAAVGLGIAYAGQEAAESLEGGERLGGAVLIAFGALYAIFDLRHLGHRHMHHVHDGEVHDSHHHATALGDQAAIASLVLVLSVSPCIALTGVFFNAGGIGGLAAAGLIAGVNAAVTVPVMTAMVLLASRGLELVRLERIERHERVIVGALLGAIGVVVLLLHHEHPA